MVTRGRRLLGMMLLVIGGEPVARVARGMGMSRQCVSKWVRRYREEGRAGLEDRSSRPRCSPMRTSREVEEQVLRSVASVGMCLSDRRAAQNPPSTPLQPWRQTTNLQTVTNLPAMYS